MVKNSPIKPPPQYRPKLSSFITGYKKAIALTLKGRKVSITWNGDYLDRLGLREWFMTGLNHKINIKGNIRIDYRDKQSDLWVDSQIYTTWVQLQNKTQYGIQFRTKYFKKRFPQIEESMKRRFQQAQIYD